MFVQPRAEEGGDFVGQAHEDIADVARAGGGDAGDDAFDFMIVDRWDDGRHVGGHGHARLRQPGDGGQALFGMSGARLQRASDPGIERRDRNHYRDQIVARQIGEQVDVLQDAIGLGGNEGGMPGLH